MRTFLAASLIACSSLALSQTAPPPAPRRPVMDTYNNVKVTDNYRWLEDGAAPEVKQWVGQQNAWTAAYMDKLPQRDAILAWLKQRMKNEHTQYESFQIREGRLFALRFDPGQGGAKLVVFTSPKDQSSEQLILDTTKFETGKVFQVDWYSISPNGKLAGLALSTGGSEDASLYVIDAASGHQVGEAVPRANFATGGGAMAWTSDNSGFYYTRYPQGNERPEADANFYQQIYLHRMGTPASADRYVIGKEFPRIAETTLALSPDSSRVLITVANGDGGDFEDFVLGPDGKPQQVAQFGDRVAMAAFGVDNSLWLLSHKNSDKGELWHLPAGDTKLSDAKLVVQATDASLEGDGSDQQAILVGTDKLYVTVINGGPEEVRVYNFDGTRLDDVPLPKIASVSPLVRDGNDAFLFAAETFTTPQQWYRFDGKGTPQALPFHDETDIKLDDILVERAFATSKDGTRVPMMILRRDGTKLDGQNRTLITGYGGFDISTTPRFYGDRLWFDHGGIVAITNIRGGAEYGESWHAAGNLTHKQNVFDDFAACAQYLISHGYTSPQHLAAEGGSNGGLLMGAEITQHPELFRVVVSYVGIYDMLRTELDPNGTFNITEYGTVNDPAQFRALYAYSPYHHVAQGTKYPAVLLITGDNDHRVNPAHSRKMTAALQSATSSGLPILLLTNANAGHGISTNVDEALLEEADATAFLFANLGMTMQ
ncbi:MAG TPA: prolyl oligopeptidase family serine peptidase [Acidobacteriaceae bacterium]|nr:prolyl oligopeptidase family serine peptidase [Acidobacteriaceae bacterium]